MVPFFTLDHGRTVLCQKDRCHFSHKRFGIRNAAGRKETGAVFLP